MSGANLISSLQAAEADAAEASSGPGEAETQPSAQPIAGTLTNLPPASSIPLPQDWLQDIYDVVDALAALQLPAQVLAVLSAAVRQDVHEAISALGKDWIFVPVLAAVEQYVASAPLLLLRHLLPRMVSLHLFHAHRMAGSMPQGQACTDNSTLCLHVLPEPGCQNPSRSLPRLSLPMPSRHVSAEIQQAHIATSDNALSSGHWTVNAW